MTSQIQAMISIDSGPETPGSINIEQNTETIYSDIAVKPDPGWEYVDGHDHFHAFDKSGDLPTLRTRPRHVDCNGSCGGVCGGEGYDVVDYFCHICDEQVTPQYLPDRDPKIIPTTRSWTVEVGQQVDMRAEVSVRATMGDTVMFGAAVGTDFSFADERYTSRLLGIGQLGIRSRPRAAVTSSEGGRG
jgi:hypothetical protein